MYLFEDLFKNVSKIHYEILVNKSSLIENIFMQIHFKIIY